MDPNYFKRELRPYEAEAYLEGLEMQRRDGWEKTRVQSFYALSSCREGVDPKTFMPLPWDTKKAAKVTEATEEELSELFNWAAEEAQHLKTDGEE